MPQATDNLIAGVATYASMGYATFPTHNKKPVRKGQDWANSIIDLIPEASTYPYGEFGIVLKSENLIIDIDPRNFPPGEKVWSNFCRDFNIPAYVQQSFSVQTTSGGFHIYLKKPAMFGIRKNLPQYPGLDFLSVGNYVIGAGSVVDSKSYNVIVQGEHKDAPAELLNAIKREAREYNLEGTEGFRDTPENISKYIEYLNAQPSAIEGRSGDIETFKVACHGRDQNLSAQKTTELLAQYFNPRCQPPWSYDELSVKVQNAYAYAKNPAGVQDPFAVFPEMEEVKPVEDRKWMTLLDIRGKGSNAVYANSFNNCVLMIENEKELKNRFRFNQFTSKIEVTDRMPWEEERKNPSRVINDLEVSHVALHLAKKFKVEFSTPKTWEALHLIANKAPYHPIREEIASYVWDGTKRLDTWLPYYCGAVDNEYTRHVGRKTLVGACARLFSPGCKFDYVLIMEGEQGTGKSATCRIIGGKWFGDSHLDVQDKDTVEYVQSHWIIEFAELSSMRKTDVNRLKNFISNQVDNMRPPYARSRMVFPRQCVFIGTVNPDSIGYLVDDTGNRRFWPVTCGQFKLKELERDRNQLLAEAYDAFKKGEQLHLTTDIELMARAETKKRIVKDPWHDPIERWLQQHEHQYVTSEQLYTLCLGGTAQQMNTGHARRIVAALKLLGYTESRRNFGMAWIKPTQENPFATVHR